MTVQTALQTYIVESGETMRALSLRAHLNPKAVSDILSIPGLQPRRKSLVALSEATGIDLVAESGFETITYAALLNRLEEQGYTALRSRVRTLLRKANWTAETTHVCRHDAIDFFERHTAASLGVTPGTFATYKSDVLKALDVALGRQRARNVSDIGGEHGALHDAITDTPVPHSWKLISGSFLLYLHDRGIALADITTDVLADYYAHRCEVSSKTEAKCRAHVAEIAQMVTQLSRHAAFRRFGLPAVAHPFADGRDKYRVDDALVAPILEDYDRRIVPWVRGEISRSGETREAFIARLDASEDDVSEKKARLRAAQAERRQRSGKSGRPDRKSDAEKLAMNGFLTPKGFWSETTIATRRGYVAALAKALIAATEIVPDSLEELCDPEYLDVAAEALADANKGTFSTGYVASILKAMKKLARDYYQTPPDRLQAIDDLITRHAVADRGIAPRNKAKLERFTDTRIGKLLNLSDVILAGVNADLATRRKAWRKRHAGAPTSADIVTSALAQDIMAALAHDILLARAPRTANVVNCRLDWIAWRDDGKARIVVPSAEVKMRGADDPDLVIPLLGSTSRLLRKYLDTIRPIALRAGDETNPYLFPSQAADHQFVPGRAYESLLGRVTRLVDRHVGVDINPHLYRHLIGWIWLQDSIDNLPAVQRLLGHKRLQTTLDHYAELDENLVLDTWQDWINQQRTST